MSRVLGIFESFIHPFEPYEAWLGENDFMTKCSVEEWLISEFIAERYPDNESLDRLVWINKLHCPICEWGVMGECEWDESSAERGFIALTSAGCAKCDYLISDKEVAGIMFGNKLTSEQKEKMRFDSTVSVEDNKYFLAGHY